MKNRSDNWYIGTLVFGYIGNFLLLMGPGKKVSRGIVSVAILFIFTSRKSGNVSWNY